MKEGEIKSLFDDWNAALETRDPKKVAALYDKDGILLPTVSNQVRYNHGEIEDYFIDFLAKGPSGTINDSSVRIFDRIALHSGVYTFTFRAGSPVTARFTFVYRRDGQGWKIVEHHSSQMPEPVALIEVELA